MILQEIVGAAYLAWPAVFALVVVAFVLGIVVALCFGSVFAGGALAAYYLSVWLKKREVFSRGFSWITDTFRTNIRETFQLRGVDAAAAAGPCLFIAHPHGLFSMAPFFHWGVRITGWPTNHAVRIAVHRIFFSIPVLRELAEAHNAIEATEEEIEKALKAGISVVLLTGGVREIHETCSGKMRIVLKKRSGFLRIAQRLGVPIVPVLSFGENELFPPYRAAWIERCQTYLRRWFHVYVPVPTWESVRNWVRLFRGPLETKVVTCIGHAVTEPTMEKVVAEIQRLYSAERPATYPTEMEFVV